MRTTLIILFSAVTLTKVEACPSNPANMRSTVARETTMPCVIESLRIETYAMIADTNKTFCPLSLLIIKLGLPESPGFALTPAKSTPSSKKIASPQATVALYPLTRTPLSPCLCSISKAIGLSLLPRCLFIAKIAKSSVSSFPEARRLRRTTVASPNRSPLLLSISTVGYFLTTWVAVKRIS